MKAKKYKLFAGIFLCVFGMAFITTGALITNKKASNLSVLKEYGIYTQATISDIQIVDTIDDAPIYSAFVDFTTTNNNYITRANLKYYHSNMRIGDSVNIYYCPDNPYDIASGQEPMWLYFLIFRAGGGILALYLGLELIIKSAKSFYNP